MEDITSRDVAKIIKEYLETGREISEIVLDRYGNVSEAEAKEITRIIKEKFYNAVDFCKLNYGRVSVDKIMEVLKLPRDKVQTTTLDSEGHIVPGKVVEGGISFDPSHKTDFDEPKIGTSSVEFNDESVKGMTLEEYAKAHPEEASRAFAKAYKDFYGIEGDSKDIPNIEGMTLEEYVKTHPKEASKIRSQVYKDLRDNGVDSKNIPAFDEGEPEGIKIVKPGEKDPEFSFPKSDKIKPSEKEDVTKATIDESSIPTPSFDEQDSYDVLLGIGKKKEDSDFALPKSNNQTINETNRDTMISKMTNGDAKAMDAVFSILNSPFGEIDISRLDILDIRGEKLAKLFNECCGKNPGKLHRTVQFFGWSVFSKDEIHKNLGLPTPIPFIDDTITFEGIPSYDKEIDSTNDKWGEYCRKNREVFIKKLFSATYQQPSSGLGSK